MMTITFTVWSPRENEALGATKIDCKDVTEIELSYLRSLLTPENVEKHLDQIRQQSDLPAQG